MTSKAGNGRAFLKPLALLGVLAVALLAGVLAVGTVPVARAATFNIADGDVPGLITAINTANGNGVADTINLAAGGTYTLTAVDNTNVCVGPNGLPVISSEITINGNGATIERSSAAPLFRIFCVDSNLTLNAVTVSGGKLFVQGVGGGIAVDNGTLTLIDSTVSGNSAPSAGGIMNGPLPTAGTVTLINSTVRDNSADGAGGGGIYSESLGTVTLIDSTVSGNSGKAIAGGIRSINGFVTLTNSTVSGNSAGRGGGIHNSASTLTNGTLTLTNSTVSGNTATAGSGGGISNIGFGTLTLTNSTVSDNSAGGDGGGISNTATATATLSNSTVSDNLAGGFGGGISNTATATLKNTIVANSTAGGDCSGTITTLGNNLDSDGTCGLGLGDLPNTNPLLGPLALNPPGSTATHALLPGSPAIDAGSLDCPPPAADQRGVARPQGLACDIGAFELVLDTDDDGVPDVTDACPTTPGLADRQGCPVGDENLVELHVVDQAKSGVCPDGKGSCKEPIEGAEVRVFDRNDSDFQTEYGTKNPSGSQYAVVFEAGTGQIADCTTDASGQCTAGEETTGDYLVIVKYEDAETGKTVYTGKPKSPGDFDATGLASKDFQVIKVLKKNGDIQFSGGKKTVVAGSYLEVVHPDLAIWEDVAAGYVYPFIFTSDSDWTVDVCAYVPTGYDIVGVYDENGDLLTDSSCTQTFVSGETKVAAFDVIEVGSPEPVLSVLLTVEHEGTVTEVDIDIPGERTYVEEPAQLPDTGAGESGGGTPVWPAVAALVGVSVMLLGGAVIWRRRRA